MHLNAKARPTWRRSGALVALSVAGVLLVTAACQSGASASLHHDAITSSTAAQASSTTTSTAAVRRGSTTTTGPLLTYDYDNARSGYFGGSKAIKGLSANPVWDDTHVDGEVYAEPLVDDGTVYVATEADAVYALDAATGAVRWHKSYGTPVSTSVIDSAPTLYGGCGDIDPLGMTGTPVIDPALGELFVAEETELAGHTGWQGIRHDLLAISLATGKVAWERDIDPPHPNEASTYYIAAEQQRPAVTLANGRIYVAFGGLSGDCGQYHGYVEGVNVSGTGSLLSYQVPTEREGAIWETNGALVAPNGDLYVATGNGSSNSIADFDEGNSVVELSPTLHRISFWAPLNWVQLNDEDWDLGSAGPIQVPGTDLLFVAGKPSNTGSFGYLMKEGTLKGIGKGDYRGLDCTGGGVFGANASDVIGSGKKLKRYLYTACGGGTEALSVTVSPMRFTEAWTASTGSPDGPPIVAGGVVWALNWQSFQLFGMSPTTGKVLVQRNTDPLDHFATPSVADGKLFVGTQEGVEAFNTVS